MLRTAVPDQALYRPEREVASCHAAACGGAVRVAGGAAMGGDGYLTRALGHAVAPRTETLVLARGTHRTRVSEMRLAATRAATPRPDRSDTGRRGRRAGTERNREGSVHPRTG